MMGNDSVFFVCFNDFCFQQPILECNNTIKEISLNNMPKIIWDLTDLRNAFGRIRNRYLFCIFTPSQNKAHKSNKHTH